MKFTADTARTLKLPSDKIDHLVFDESCPGLGVRIRKSGIRTWVFQYQIGKRTPRLTLGRAEALTLTQARKRWGELHALVRQGKDPAIEKAERRQHAAETMGAIVRSYLAKRRSSLRASTVYGTEYCLLRLCKPLHALPLVKIDRRAIASLLTVVTEQNGHTQSNKVRSTLSAFFAWSISQGFLDVNPVTGTERQPEKPRERVLSMAELVTIWQACSATTIDHHLIVRLLMLTGARKAEIGGLRWSEVDILSPMVANADYIRLPGARTKNHRPHNIPITAPMAKILAARPRRPGSDPVFGRIPGRPYNGYSENKVRLDELLLGQIGEPWVLHDIRRSVATHMAERDVPPHIVEAILNHISGHKGGVAGIYNRASYEQQIRHALTMWGEHLMAAVEGKPADDGKVVQLR